MSKFKYKYKILMLLLFSFVNLENENERMNGGNKIKCRKHQCATVTHIESRLRQTERFAWSILLCCSRSRSRHFVFCHSSPFDHNQLYLQSSVCVCNMLVWLLLSDLALSNPPYRLQIEYELFIRLVYYVRAIVTTDITIVFMVSGM